MLAGIGGGAAVKRHPSLSISDEVSVRVQNLVLHSPSSRACVELYVARNERTTEER